MGQSKFTIDMLRQVFESDFTVPNGIDPFKFALEIRTNLRSSDQELRDKLTYSILCQLLDRNELNVQQMRELMILSTDELVFGIGECGTDTVFARSFSVLIIAAILIVDSTTPRLTVEDVRYATEKVIEYAFAEQDYRGYVEEKGWAHSVAHTADALGACALHPYATNDNRLGILDAIRHLASLASPLSFEEEDRLAYPVLRMVLADKESLINWEQWIMSFEADHSPSGHDTLRLVNVGHFLRSLYLLLLWECPECRFLTVLEQQTKRLHGLYHYGALPIDARS